MKFTTLHHVSITVSSISALPGFGRQAFFEDVAGNLIEFIQPAS